MEYLTISLMTGLVYVLYGYRYVQVIHQVKVLLSLGSQADKSEVDWDNLGDKPAYPDTSDHETADLAANLISLEVQAEAEHDTAKRAKLLGEIKEKYKLLLQLSTLPFDAPPAYADSFFDEDEGVEQPSNIIDFAAKTAKPKTV